MIFCMANNNNQEIIHVPFHSQVVLGIKTENKVYIPLKPICENLGLDWEAQRKRIRRDTVLSQGASMMEVPSKGGPQETICLPLEYLNGWLFGIDENRVNTEIKELVIQYKKECYIVLHDYFYNGYSLNKKSLEDKPEQIEQLSDEIRALRMEDKALHKKMTDAMVLTCSDYNSLEKQEKNRLFAHIQNMIHFAVSGKVSAELVWENVNYSKPFAGMTSYDKELKDVQKKDLLVGKNYLKKKSFRQFQLLYDVFFAFVEMKLLNGEKITLDQWEHQLKDVIINFGLSPFYSKYVNITRRCANEKVETEWSKFKPLKKQLLQDNK